MCQCCHPPSSPPLPVGERGRHRHVLLLKFLACEVARNTQPRDTVCERRNKGYEECVSGFSKDSDTFCSLLMTYVNPRSYHHVIIFQIKSFSIQQLLYKVRLFECIHFYCLFFQLPLLFAGRVMCACI